MSLKLDGTGKITGIDQGLSVVGVTTLHNELSVSGDVVVGGGLTVTGVLTYEDVTNVDSIGIITARSGIVGDLTGNVTGDITGNIIGSPTLSGISSSIADTAVDIFVYDTSKDSDGGAWRKRTQHTSWYNETLNTATRGSRREFPAVAVIVAETGKVTIYDGDDPDLPMWMVYNDTVTFSTVYALNGKLVIGRTGSAYSGGYQLPIFDFIKDKVNVLATVGNGLFPFGISDRDNINGGLYINNDGYGQIVEGTINDVAMTVLSNAPIDSATGLPVPTIAVATDGGTSIIKNDGTVIDITPYSDDYVAFDNNNLIIGRGDGSSIVYAGPMPSADIAETSWRAQSDVTYFGAPTAANIDVYTSTYDPGNLTGVTKNAFSFDSSIGKVVKFDLNTINANSTMVAYATTSYNTGWMHGDIKGAFLSDTDTTNVTGGNIVTNGDDWTGAQSSTSTTPPNGWTGGNAAQFKTHSGGDGTYIRLVNAGSSQGGPNSYMYQAITTVPGRKYKISLTQYHHATISVYYSVGTSINGGELVTSTWVSSSSNTPRDEHNTFTATGTTTYLTLGITSGTNNYDTGWDNVLITEVVDDRSVNENGLNSYGTITKSAVATGAELVAYSGFSNSNYLRQLHNADLNVGTGDFYIMCWVKGNQLMLWHRNDSGTLDMRCEFPTSGGSANKPRFLFSNGGVSLDFYATTAFDTTTWHHCVWVKRGARNGELYIDGVLNNSGTAGSDLSLDGTNSTFSIGNRADSSTEAFNGYVSLFKFGASAPSAEQVKKMYEDEKFLFQENAACTLYGSSDAVTALAYDEVTDRLHVGTSSGRSDFQGLRRINNTTTAVTTAISAHDEFIAEQ